MIKSISYWSMKDGLAGTHPIEDALTTAKATGFAGLELCISPPAPGAVLHLDTTQEQCREMRQAVDRSGVVVQTLAAGLAWGCNPVSDDAAVREQSVQMHAAALQRAAWLGCDAMLMVPGVVGCPFVPDQKVRYDRAIDRCREAVKRLLDTAERVAVDLCIENVWNGMFLSPVELRDFIDSFGSSRLGVYFDVGNLLGYHQHPPHWIELLGKRIKRVHIKDFKHEFDWSGKYSFCRLGEGDVPWPESMAALRSVGYDRTIVAEMLPHQPGLLEHTSAAMDRILQGK